MRSVSRLLPAAWWHLQAAPDDYSRQMLRLAASTNIHTKNYFISFQTWFHVKIKFFKISLFHFRRGSVLK